MTAKPQADEKDKSILQALSDWAKSPTPPRDKRSGGLFGVNELTASIFTIAEIMLASAFIAALAASVAGMGLVNIIGDIYAKTCYVTGSCEMSTLNSGMTIAAIILTGLLLAVAVPLVSASTTSNDDIKELLHMALDEMEEIKTLQMDGQELLEAGADEAALVNLELIEVTADEENI